MKFKRLLWQIGILKESKCPYCKLELLPSYGDGCHVYRCSYKECEFNKE